MKKRKREIEKDIRTRAREGKEWAFCRGLLGMESIQLGTVDEEKGPKDLLVLRNNGILSRWSNEDRGSGDGFLVSIYRMFG